MFNHAIVRKPGPDAFQGLTTADLGAPDYALLLQQHAAYVATLRLLGLTIVELDSLPGYPDAYFVEDVAVVVPEVAVITRPGAAARRGEANHMVEVIGRYRSLVSIITPGTLEGGDVLVVGKHVMVGLSDRTNAEGARQLALALSPFGYTTAAIPVGDGLHFKSSVNDLGDNTLLITRDFADHPALAPYERLVIDNDEAYAANTLWVNGTLITPEGFPKTQAQLAELNRPILPLNTSEMRKMDGGLTCLSLRF
jgi:dimethylargininase